MNGIHLDVSTFGFILGKLLWHKYTKGSVFSLTTGEKATHGELLQNDYSTLLSQFNLEYHCMQINTTVKFIEREQSRLIQLPQKKGNTLFYKREAAFCYEVLKTPPEYSF